MSSTTETHMAIRSESLNEALTNSLVEAAREVLRELILVPSVEVRYIDVEVLHSPRFDSDVPRTSYLVTVTTNDATLLRGAVARYKGSYKERLEAVLDRIVKQADPLGVAHVNIAGPDTPTVDRLIPIRALIQSKRVSARSPIVKTARDNGIDYIQTRGRHLIAPSPAIAEFLVKYCTRNRERIRHAADLFAGTAIATKIILRNTQPERVVAIENDPMKIARIRQHISDKRVEVLSTDVMNFSFVEQYDLAIADPYYEDVELFLDRQIENLRRKVRVLLLVPGNIEDRVWNQHIRSKLESARYEVVSHEIYGQVIFEATHLVW